jgi:stringent starvation protein B
MGESVNCILLVAYVLVVWASYAQENGESWVPIKFPSEDEKPPIPQTSTENITQRNGDSVIFTHDHDHTTSRDDNYTTQVSTRNSLEVCN